MADPILARAPAHIRGYRRDGSPDARGMNERLSGQVIDHLEMGALSAEGYSVTKIVMRSGLTILVTPMPVPPEVGRQTGARWATAWALFHPKERATIVLPGVGVPEFG